MKKGKNMSYYFSSNFTYKVFGQSPSNFASALKFPPHWSRVAEKEGLWDMKKNSLDSRRH